jgi:hypothetical protein
MNFCQYWLHLLSDLNGNQCREGCAFLVVISEICECTFKLYKGVLINPWPDLFLDVIGWN